MDKNKVSVSEDLQDELRVKSMSLMISVMPKIERELLNMKIVELISSKSGDDICESFEGESPKENPVGWKMAVNLTDITKAIKIGAIMEQSQVFELIVIRMRKVFNDKQNQENKELLDKIFNCKDNEEFRKLYEDLCKVCDKEKILLIK